MTSTWTRTALAAAITLASAAALAAPAHAQGEAGVNDKILALERTLFDLPDSGTEVDITRFEAEWRGGIIADTYRYEHQDGGAMVTFKVHQGEKFGPFAKGIKEMVGKAVEEPSFEGRVKRRRINDMRAAMAAGEGTCGDNPCHFNVIVYESRPDTIVVAFAFVNKDKAERLKDARTFISNVDLNDEERKAQKKPRRKKKKKRRGRRR